MMMVIMIDDDATPNTFFARMPKRRSIVRLLHNFPLNT